MFRVISEVRPTWVLGENVAGIIDMGIEQVLSDLEGIGYDIQVFAIPACAVNAPHRRNRVWIVAHSKQSGWRSSKKVISSEIRNLGNNIEPDGICNGEKTWFKWHTKKTKWNLEIESAIFGKDDGFPGGLDEIESRLKALGNSIVPQVALQIFLAMVEAENGKM
jgi:DNA (cytosine-5)-methyltransferase 1